MVWLECPLSRPDRGLPQPQWTQRADAVTYEPIVRYAPMIVPLILVCGIAAATIYRPPPPSNSSGYAATNGCVGVGPKCAR